MEGLAALERGALSCEAWTRACLERIEQRNGQVQAWVQVDAHGALARAAHGTATDASACWTACRWASRTR